MKYNIRKDIEAVCVLLDINQSQLAEYLNVSRSTIKRIVNGVTNPSALFLESFYSFAFQNQIRDLRLNDLKIQFAKDKFDKVLFHATKAEINGPIDLSHSRKDIDVGVGFYLGESYDQSASYIFMNKNSSVYLFDARELERLKVVEFSVSFEWMIMVCYYRGQIERFKDSPIVKKIIDKVESCDVVIAPIADNNMYETMNQFARGDITDLQAKNALSASNLGKQHVLKTMKACNSVKIVDRLYLCQPERKEIEKIRIQNASIASDKSKLSIEQLRHQGKYIEELLK